jgi:hypothetical protein
LEPTIKEIMLALKGQSGRSYQNLHKFNWLLIKIGQFSSYLSAILLAKIQFVIKSFGF